MAIIIALFVLLWAATNGCWIWMVLGILWIPLRFHVDIVRFLPVLWYLACLAGAFHHDAKWDVWWEGLANGNGIIHPTNSIRNSNSSEKISSICVVKQNIKGEFACQQEISLIMRGVFLWYESFQYVSTSSFSYEKLFHFDGISLFSFEFGVGVTDERRVDSGFCLRGSDFLCESEVTKKYEKVKVVERGWASSAFTELP
jgi:hypothetical protein